MSDFWKGYFASIWDDFVFPLFLLIGTAGTMAGIIIGWINCVEDYPEITLSLSAAVVVGIILLCHYDGYKRKYERADYARRIGEDE